MRLVVVGNGMAGMRTVEELLRIAPDLYDITVFGAEPSELSLLWFLYYLQTGGGLSAVKLGRAGGWPCRGPSRKGGGVGR